MEPEGITYGVGCCFASEDEMPSNGDVFYALEMGGGGEGEQVDAAKDTWRKVWITISQSVQLICRMNLSVEICFESEHSPRHISRLKILSKRGIMDSGNTYRAEGRLLLKRGP